MKTYSRNIEKIKIDLKKIKKVVNILNKKYNQRNIIL